MTYDPDAIIVAIASAPGRSARGILRASGAWVLDLVAELLDPLPGDHHLNPSRLTIGSREIPCLATISQKPASYTGEDTLEIQLPGNSLLLAEIVEALIQSGCDRELSIRRAEPGEFTARAFFAGRITLTQAEGVAATIAARSDGELTAASMLTGGKLGALARDLANQLASALALVEAGIDFTDQDDVIAITPDDLHHRLVVVRDQVEAYLKRSVGFEQLEAIPWVVLAGEPNAGKSTLFNALLGQERAVISRVAGTTRDVLVEPLHLGDSAESPEVMLVDLAGFDAGEAGLNPLMQSAAADAMSRAELVLRCVPIDCDVGTIAPGELVVRTKADRHQRTMRHETADAIAVSAVSRRGLTTLRTVIGQRLKDKTTSLAGNALVLGARHEAALRSAGSHLDEAIELTETSTAEHALLEPEVLAVTMRLALNDLCELAGAITPDDVLGRVFSTFCVGK